MQVVKRVGSSSGSGTITIFSFLFWYLSAQIALPLMTAVVKLFLLTVRYLLGLVRDAASFSVFCVFGSIVMAYHIILQPIRVFYWFLVGFGTAVPGAMRVPNSYSNGRALHQKFLSHGTGSYLPRLNLRFLIFSAYQICPSCAYIL